MIARASIENLERRTLFDAGDLDSTFGTSGLAQVTFADAFLASDFASLVDGSMLVAGHTVVTPAGQPSQTTPTIARLRADGSLDTRFGNGGFLIDTPGGMQTLAAIEPLPSGGFFIAGSRNIAPTQNVAVLAKYTLLGRRDRTFDRFNRGSVLVPLLSDANDILVQTDGKIVLAGHATQGGDATIARLRSDGRPDTTFGQSGIVPGAQLSVGEESADAFVVAGPNETLVVGRNHSIDNLDFPGQRDRTIRITRYLADGSLDTSFGGTGIISPPQIETAQGLPDDVQRGLAVGSDGAVTIVHGPSGAAQGDELQVVHFTSAGALDVSFGAGGVASAPANFVSLNDGTAPRELLLDSNGRLMIPGGAVNNPSGVAPALARFNDDGGIDATFGTNGVAQLDVNSSAANTAPVVLPALAPDGTLVAALFDRTIATTENVARIFLSDSPVATLTRARPILAQSLISQVLVVQYRDDGFINTSSLDNLDLRITGPGGFVRHARFIDSATFNGNIVAATYKVAARNGAWDASDNGQYVVQLVGRQVADVEGNFAAGRILGSFIVQA